MDDYHFCNHLVSGSAILIYSSFPVNYCAPKLAVYYENLFDAFVFVFQNFQIFRQIVKDVFQGLPDPPSPAHGTHSALSRSGDSNLENALESTASEYGLVPHKAFIEKCQQLYNISMVHSGMCINSVHWRGPALHPPYAPAHSHFTFQLTPGPLKP